MTLLTKIEIRSRGWERHGRRGGWPGLSLWALENADLSIVSAMAPSLGVETADSDDVKKIIMAHREFTLSVTPPEFVFSLGVEGLLEPDVQVVVLRDNGEALSIGALRPIETGHFEIKSMHTLARVRKMGYSRQVLQYLINLARESGAQRVSLETGSGAPFEAARALYESVGFVPCGPFGSYPDHDGNFFMTLLLEQ